MKLREVAQSTLFYVHVLNTGVRFQGGPFSVLQHSSLWPQSLIGQTLPHPPTHTKHTAQNIPYALKIFKLKLLRVN